MKVSLPSFCAKLSTGAISAFRVELASAVQISSFTLLLLSSRSEYLSCCVVFTSCLFLKVSVAVGRKSVAQVYRRSSLSAVPGHE